MFIQSFEQGNLRELRKKTTVRLIQLVSPAVIRRRRAEDIATYADGIGPEKRLLVPVNLTARWNRRPTWWRAHTGGAARARVDDANRAQFLPAGYKGDVRRGVRAAPPARRRRRLHGFSRIWR